MVCSIAQWLAYLRLDPAAPGSNHSSRVYEFITEKITNDALLIDSILWAVKSLIKLIEPIQNWPVASL